MASILYKGKAGGASLQSPSVSPVAISATSLFAAYSVNRQIVSGYTGDLLEGILFDGGNQTTIQLGQSSGILSLSAISAQTFFVPTKVFDQSGNGNHLILDRQSSVNSHHSLSWVNNRYVIDANQVCFSLTTNWSDSSSICVYKDATATFGRGQDGFGAWSWLFSLVTYVSITQSPNQAYTTTFTSSQKAVGFTDFAGTTQGILTAGQSLTTTIPNNLFRNSSVRVLSNFTNGTLYSGWFAEFVVYTSALNSTNRQTLLDTLSA